VNDPEIVYHDQNTSQLQIAYAKSDNEFAKDSLVVAQETMETQKRYKIIYLVGKTNGKRNLRIKEL
jgi:hypothetical protein